MYETKEKDNVLIEEITARITAFLKSEIVCFTERRKNGVAICLPGGKKILVSIQKE